jgi:hypothetical protein
MHDVMALAYQGSCQFIASVPGGRRHDARAAAGDHGRDRDAPLTPSENSRWVVRTPASCDAAAGCNTPAGDEPVPQ